MQSNKDLEEVLQQAEKRVDVCPTLRLHRDAKVLSGMPVPVPVRVGEGLRERGGKRGEGKEERGKRRGVGVGQAGRGQKRATCGIYARSCV